MKRTHLIQSLFVTAIGGLTPTLLAILAPGCGEPAEIATFNPGCPNPLLGRRVTDLGYEFIDPCCQRVPCPGHDPWKAADAGPDSSTPKGTGGSSGSTGGSSGDTGGSSGGAGGSKGAACGGICAPKPPPGWSGPFLLWTGPPGSAPPCPPSASRTILMNGYAGLVAPPAICGACFCSAPSGTCSAPDDIAVTSGSCPYEPTTDIRTPLHTPTDGSGACTPTTKLPPGASCNGEPCARSITIGPLSLNEMACTSAKVAPDQVPAASWSLEAQGCAPDEAACGACSAPGTTCVPPHEEREGRALCTFTFGEEECSTPWQDKHLLYRSFADSRGCSPCGCSAPAGGRCAGRLTLFRDGACKAPLVTTEVKSGAQPACRTFDKPGPAIGSMKLDKAAYAPGACPATGGAAVGSAKTTAPLTVCCTPL